MQLYLVRGEFLYGVGLTSYRIYDFVVMSKLGWAKHEAVRLMFKMFKDHSDKGMEWTDHMTLIRDYKSEHGERKYGKVNIIEMTLDRTIENLEECKVHEY